MPDLADGESYFMKGSGARPYELKNSGGVYSCNCPAWRNQSLPIEQRTCKHLRKLRGDEAEDARIGRTGALPAPRKAKTDEDKDGAPVLLAETWDNVLDLTGWWLSEKLDGVRAYWDGKQFLSRQGNRYHAPDWFVEGLPDVPLDGELWLGRKKFQRAVSIARRQDRSDHWRELRYVIFDAPGVAAEFETRVEFYQDYLRSQTPPFAVAHPQEVCRDLEHLRAELDRIEALGGEGLMLRQPRSKYEVGRSSTLLKVKRFLDAEAKVLKHEPGAGRHKGRLGALYVELPNGTQFSVGTGFSDAERDNPPPLGSTIQFRYQELSEAGVPRFPSYLGLRTDAPVTTPTPVEAATRRVKAQAVSVAVPAPVPCAPASSAAPASGGKPRYFEFVEGTSSKFWEVSLKGVEMMTRWGRIGTTGQSKTKTFKDEAAALAAAAKLVEEKTGDGYVER
jgi:DNA ligase-1